jgi:hypothetical protein
LTGDYQVGGGKFTTMYHDLLLVLAGSFPFGTMYHISIALLGVDFQKSALTDSRYSVAARHSHCSSKEQVATVAQM